MMIPSSCSSREFGHETLHHRALSVSKHVSSQSAFKARALLGFNLHNSSSASLRLYPLPRYLLPFKQFPSGTIKHVPGAPRVSLGFKLHCHSKAVVVPARGSKLNGRKQKYGGVLPSILRSLESDAEMESTLSSCCKNLSPKEQTVILKEQRSWERVLRVFRFFKSRTDYVPNVIHYNIVLRALGRAGRWDELRLCWIEMAQKGVLPTNNTYGMLVDVYGKAGLVSEALLWIKHMGQRGLFPDEVAMTTVVRVLKDAGEYDRADRFFKDWCSGRVNMGDLELDSMDNFRNGSESSSPVSLKHFLSMELFRIGARNPIKNRIGSAGTDGPAQKPRLTSTYNTLIDLYGKSQRLKDAADVFSEMLNSGVAMDTVTFNTLIFTCGSHGRLSEAESLLAKMEEKGISPDTKTYNIFLSLYAGGGNIDAALKCYQKIREVGLFPDTVTHRAVLHMLCQRNMVSEVETVLTEMNRFDIPVDEHSIPVIMKMYANEGLLSRAKDLFEKFQSDIPISSKTLAAIMDVYAEKGLWCEAEAVFYSRKNLAGRKNDVLEYNVMIKAYGKAKLYDKALSLFKGMKKQGTWPDECTYNSLIQMFSGGELVDQARELLTEMQGARYKPNCQTFSSLIASYVHLGQLSDAVDLYEEMKRTGVKPNEVVYGSLINGFAEANNVEEALKYFHMMDEHSVPSNQIVLTSLIKAYSKVGCLEGARQVYERMKSSQGGPDAVASNSMLSLYADLGMISEAEVIFDNLREKGLSDGISFATMMYLYKSMGMLDKAIEVAEEMKQSGLLQDCTSFNQVMACYATNGQLRQCGELLHEMISRRKLLPDLGTFKVLFTILKKGGIPSEAVAQLQSSYEEGKPYARQAIIVSVYSAVGLHEFALGSCEMFLKPDSPLDCFVYNATIYVYGSSGKTDKALNIYMSMQDEGLDPDIVTYIHLVGIYGKAGMLEGVKRIHSQLKYGSVQPNESLFKAVRDAYVNANRHDLAELVKKEMIFALEPDEQQSDNNESEKECVETSFEAFLV